MIDLPECSAGKISRTLGMRCILDLQMREPPQLHEEYQKPQS